GLDRATVIAATHGKRAIDNLATFRPEILAHQMDEEVMRFENSILYYADAYNKSKENSRRGSVSSSSIDSGASTPALSSRGSSSGLSSRHDSLSTPNRPVVVGDGPVVRRPSFATRLNNMLAMSTLPEGNVAEDDITAEEAMYEDKKDKLENDIEAAWEIEAEGVDRSIRILPGVKNMIESIPAGRYAVATSGAKTYADDKRLKAGKPAPDPFLLAAKCLGFPATDCVVFEDSPSGIRAGVASGATVIAVCTSHPRDKVEGNGAHFVVEDMTAVHCRVLGEGKDAKLQFTVEQ
ncbi:hypothetical protein EW145_g7371, partial [Phellinidium pouzarii]